MTPSEQQMCEQIEEEVSNGEPEGDVIANIAWSFNMSEDNVRKLWEAYQDGS